MEEVYLNYPIRYDRCSISYLHAHGIIDLPMGNVPGLQHVSMFLSKYPTSRNIASVIIYAIAVIGVATSAHAMAWCIGDCSLIACA